MISMRLSIKPITVIQQLLRSVGQTQKPKIDSLPLPRLISQFGTHHQLFHRLNKTAVLSLLNIFEYPKPSSQLHSRDNFHSHLTKSQTHLSGSDWLEKAIEAFCSYNNQEELIASPSLTFLLQPFKLHRLQLQSPADYAQAYGIFSQKLSNF